MDYAKLSDEKLDEIMKVIRAESRSNNKQNHAKTSDITDTINEHEDRFEVFNDYFQLSLKGMRIGLNKSPMHKVNPFFKPFARFVEKIYLRIAEFTNRDVRVFNSNVLTMFAQIKIILEDNLLLKEEALILEGKVKKLEGQVNKYEKVLYNFADELHGLKSKPLSLNGKIAFVRKDASVQSDKFPNPLFYHAFEERFRGTQEDIKNRLQVYLPVILEHFTSLQDKVFIDIGCGRGEFVEMLKDNGAINVTGVDLNEIQLGICKDKNLNVVNADCIDYIKNQPDNSVDMISGIQIIEHLQLDVLIELFKECKRILKSGGMFLFETLNPDNLRTAATNFYLDPTHIRPIHKDFAMFVANYAGFENVSIIEVNPVKDTDSFPPPINRGRL